MVLINLCNPRCYFGTSEVPMDLERARQLIEEIMALVSCQDICEQGGPSNRKEMHDALVGCVYQNAKELWQFIADLDCSSSNL